MKLFKFTPLDDGTYSVKVYGARGTVNSAVTVPESHEGKPVTRLVFGATMDANFRSLYIPASVKEIVFPTDDTRGAVPHMFAARVIVADENEKFKTDGSGLYSKDGSILYRLFPRYAEEYSVPGGTVILGEGAFEGHETLKRVTLPESLRSIGSKAFSGCSAMKQLDIPDGVSVMGADCLNRMISLRSLRLPCGLGEISEPFGGRLDLRELYIPASVEKISVDKVLVFLKWIDKFTVSPENRFFRSENGVIFSRDMTVLVKAPRNVPSVFYVPEGVREIAENAFYMCGGLTEAVLPESCTVIGNSAFYRCGALEKINLENVRAIGALAFYGCGLSSAELYCESIGHKAFSQCPSLCGIVLQEGLKRIEDMAFFNSPIREISIPKSVESIGDYIFGELPGITFYDNYRSKENFLSRYLMNILPDRAIIIKSAETDEIRYSILFDNVTNDLILKMIVLDCFDEFWNFDHSLFDKKVSKEDLKVLPKAFCALYRLKHPPEPQPETMKKYAGFLRKNSTAILKELISEKRLDDIIRFAEFTLGEENISEAAEYAAKENAAEIAAFLLDHRNKHYGTLPGLPDLQ